MRADPSLAPKPIKAPVIGEERTLAGGMIEQWDGERWVCVAEYVWRSAPTGEESKR